MPTETTVKGGAYQRADGTWVNAKGKPIPAPKGDVYVQPEADLAIVANQEAGLDEFGNPVNPVAEGDVKKAKTLKTTKKSGGD